MFSSYDLSGYMLSGSPRILDNGKKQYLLGQYQGEHQNEYSVMEVENGIPNGSACLYKDGIILRSWTMRNGVPEGYLTFYENGVVSKRTTWDLIENSSMTGIIKELINDVSGSCLMVEKITETGTVIYKGGYNPKDFCRKGFGIEFDEECGIETVAGYYRDNKLIHISYKFEYDRGEGHVPIMIEFDGNENVENVENVINRSPIYKGPYIFDTEKNRFIRCGCGYEINKNIGVCSRICVRNKNGVEVKSKSRTLLNGWYGEVESDSPIDIYHLIHGDEHDDEHDDGKDNT